MDTLIIHLVRRSLDLVRIVCLCARKADVKNAKQTCLQVGNNHRHQQTTKHRMLTDTCTLFLCFTFINTKCTLVNVYVDLVVFTSIAGIR